VIKFAAQGDRGHGHRVSFIWGLILERPTHQRQGSGRAGPASRTGKTSRGWSAKPGTALAGQGAPAAGGELEQGERGGHSQISQGQKLSPTRKGATKRPAPPAAQAGLQLLTAVHARFSLSGQ